MDYLQLFLILSIAGVVFGFAGEYIPKSYYLIDPEGHKSDVIYFRSKRDIEMFPLLRAKRGGGTASSGSSASAKASASSGAYGGGYGSGGSYGGDGGHYADDGGHYGGNEGNFGGNFEDFIPKFVPLNFPHPNNFGGGGYGGNGGGQAGSFASASSGSSSGSSGYGSGYGGHGTDSGSKGPTLFSRFGEDTGSGIHVSGSASGPKAAFSSSSASVDENGKIKYSVQSGKY